MSTYRDVIRRNADWSVALTAWAVSRGLALTGLAAAHWVWNRKTDGVRPVQLSQGLLAWDGAFYADLAEHGYGAVDADGHRFFPLLSGFGRSVGALPVFTSRSGVVAVAWVSALLFAVLLRRLVRADTGDDALANRAVCFALLAPNAFVLTMGYSEPLFLALSVATILALRERRFGWVVAFAAAAGVTRPVGVLLAIPIAIELWPEVRAAPRAMVGWLIAGTAAPAVAAVSFLAWVSGRYEGSITEPLSLQNAPNLRGGTEIPGPNLIEAIRLLVTGERVGYGLHAVTAVALAALVVVLARTSRPSYAVYAGATLLVALTAHNLESFERYALGAFPFAIAAASVIHSRGPFRVAVGLSAIACVMLAAMSFGGDYLP